MEEAAGPAGGVTYTVIGCASWSLGHLSGLTFHGIVKIALSIDCRSTFLTFDDSVKSQVDLWAKSLVRSVYGRFIGPPMESLLRRPTAANFAILVP